jgi:hypothetical protein
LRIYKITISDKDVKQNNNQVTTAHFDQSAVEKQNAPFLGFGILF